MEAIKTINSWLHILSSSFSLLLGLYVLVAKKGTKVHLKIGRLYFWLMLVNCVTSLFIVNALGRWFFPHWLGVVTLIILIPSYVVTFRKTYKHWLKVHIVGFVLSYYLLVGGALNELFIHVTALKHYLTNNSPVLGISHFLVQLLFVILIGFFLWKFRKMKI